MNGETPSPTPPFTPPVSSFAGPIAELIAHGMLSPPSRPGLLAILDRYEILRLLGAGGMGLVLLARDPTNGREVAVKLIKPELATDQQVVRRFVKEAGHLQRLRHEQVMPVLEVSDRPQGPYFVMPYFEQGSLARLIQPGCPLDNDLALEIAQQLCVGLQFAHRRGIIHRDLKPANVMWSANGKACLADFGLARTVFNDSVVDVESLNAEGTGPYMSPGVAAGNAEDTRCDIYAFGALLYEMLTGQPPYQGRSTREVRSQILAGPPLSIRERNPQASPDLTTVAEGAMGRELRDRYADMADVAADLQRVKEGKTPNGPRAGKPQVSSPARPRPEKVGLMLLLGFFTLAAVFMIRGPGSKSVGEKTPLIPPSTTNPVSVTTTTSAPPTLVTKATASPAAETNHEPPIKPAVTNQIPGAAPTTNLVGNVPELQMPVGLAVDAAGKVYVVDSEDSTIRKVSGEGIQHILAGFPGSRGMTNGLGGISRFINPRGVAADGAGNLFVTDSFTVRKITPDGLVTTLAGITGYPGTNDGPGLQAQFSLPSGIAVDARGNVYVADRYTLRKITPGGEVSTIAGSGGHAGSLDGPALAARFSDKEKGLAVDVAGNVYVADTFSNEIRKVSPDGMVSTVAGALDSGSADGFAATARFFRPRSLAIDRSGNLIVADSGNNAIRKINPTGAVSLLAGRPGNPGRDDGPAGVALFDQPRGVAVDSEGNIYVADSGNKLVRKITPEGLVTTIAR